PSRTAPSRGDALKLLDVTEFYSASGGGVRTYLTEKSRWLATRSEWEHVVIVPSARDAEMRWGRSRVYLLSGPRVPASPGYHFLVAGRKLAEIDRKSTRLNSSHQISSYAVFCLKKKKQRSVPH